jgi:ABC-type nitrate/sulfonate/bicarbonate transport system permease component
MGTKMTLGIVVGVMLGVWSQHSELAEKIISTIIAQVGKDLSMLI